MLSTAVALTPGDVIPADALLFEPPAALPSFTLTGDGQTAGSAETLPDGDLTLRNAMRRHIEDVLRRVGGSKRRAARALGIARSTLDRHRTGGSARRPATMPSVGPVIDELRRVLEVELDVAYALLFGSGGRGALRPTSDVDVAIELRRGAPRDTGTIGRLAARLESAAGRKVDLVLMDEAASPLAYRIFRDGRILVDRDHGALAERKARAILEYLDFRPVEERCADGVLRAAAGRG